MNEDGIGRGTEYQDLGTVFSGLLRFGYVTDVNDDKRIARVKFDDLGYTSDWLPVLISRDVIQEYPYDVPQWTEFETEDQVPQAGETKYVPHRHRLTIKPWMPKVNDQVLCLYETVRGGRGVILGGIQPWQ